MTGQPLAAHFLGSLWFQGEPRSGFVCHRNRLLVTCEHDFPPSPNGEVPEGLSWYRFLDGVHSDASDFTVLVRDAEDDVLILLSPEPLVDQSVVADLPPRTATLTGMQIYFQGVGQYFEGTKVAWHNPDSGDGRILGPGGVHGNLIKVRSQNVTPGFSGAALLHDTDIGTHVLGMISRKYNSGSYSNRDTAWAVEPFTLRTAVEVAAESAYRSDPIRNADLGPDPKLNWARLAEMLQRVPSGATVSEIQDTSFATSRGFIITRLVDFRRLD